MVKQTLQYLAIGLSMMLTTLANAQTDASTELQKELESFTTLKADFEQRVINQDNQLVDVLTGKFYLKRPGLFKWEYADDEQDIVSDGKTISFIMSDLEQVIERDFSTAIETVPSLILVTDSSKLTDLFAISKLPSQSSVNLFELLPKSLDSNYESVSVSFLNGKLLSLRLVDVLGQTTEVILSDTQINSPIADSEFRVSVPENYDVFQG